MHPPAEAIVAVSINCEPVKPRVLQTGLFIPLAPEPEKLSHVPDSQSPASERIAVSKRFAWSSMLRDDSTGPGK